MPIHHETTTDHASISYLQIRQAIGLLGIFLPFLCILIVKLFGGASPYQTSISHYYYTTAHVLFVGSLGILGALLFTYRGVNNLESRFSNFAGICALFVISFPTDFDGFKDAGRTQYLSICPEYVQTASPSYCQIIHFSSAVLLLISFAIFCLYFFQKNDVECLLDDDKKRRRNRIYKICGVIIAISLCLCFLAFLLEKKLELETRWPNFLYFFETMALIPFGISWLVKGSVLWYKSKFFLFRMVYPYLRNLPENVH